MWSWAVKECGNDFIQSCQGTDKVFNLKVLYNENYKYAFVSILVMIHQPTSQPWHSVLPARPNSGSVLSVEDSSGCSWKHHVAAATHHPPQGPRCLGDTRWADAARSNCLKAATPKNWAALAFRGEGSVSRSGWPLCGTVHSLILNEEGDRCAFPCRWWDRATAKRSLLFNVLR